MSDDLNLLNHKFDNLAETVVDIKATIRELTAVVTKLTIVEERQIHAEERHALTVKSQEKAFQQIEKINERLANLEQQVPANKRISIWIDRAIWAGAGLLAMMVLKKSGLL